MKIKKNWLLLLVAIMAVALVFTACSSSEEDTKVATPENPVIRLSTTTSVNDSGLLGYLQPYFEEDTGYKLEITSNGTGAAIALGQSGDTDCLLVHAKASEEEFINAGYGVERIPFMYNYFVIVGPESDPAGVADCANAAEAFTAIANSGSEFVSRGDDSGTNKAELKIWAANNMDPTGQSWYISSGSGMGATLNQASERLAYCFTDKATYLASSANLDLKILLAESEDLMNTYSMIAVNTEKWPDTNIEGANAFIEWMTSEKASELIADFGVEQYGEPLFFVIDNQK